MIDYIIGKITYKNDYYILLESNYKGYKIYTSDPNKFDFENVNKVFISVKVFQNNKNNFIYEYYGFKTLKEKIFFENLLLVNGVGSKTGLAILKNDVDIIKELIKNEDASSLSMLEGFNQKNSLTIISALSFKFKNEKRSHVDNLADESKKNNIESNTNYNLTSDLISALKALGYKKATIEKALTSLIKDISTANEDGLNDLISKAIKVILNETSAS